jgi:thiamine pyrophosphate-dependent acetolactate synthase large subunit-like protein
MSAKAEGVLSSVATLKPRSEFPAADDVARIAERIDKAGNVVIMCGAGCRDAGDLLPALSDRLRAPLIHTVRGKELMAYDNPRWMGGLGMIGTKPVYHAVQNCDLLLMVGTDYPYSNPADQGRGDPDRRAAAGAGPAAVGTALGQANGVQALDRSRQVIVLTGDGGFNMLMGEFMTAVHHRLPLKIIVYNNSALGLITLEAESVGIVPFREAIEFPNPDFAALARACGGHGFTARRPAELKAALSEALAVDGPAIVDAVVVADEMPNMPHVELEQIGNFAVAKIKEAVLAVTGG